VAQHCQLQRDQAGTGHQPELRAKATANPTQHAERLHRATGTVERPRQQRGAALIERFLFEQRCSSRHRIIDPPSGKACFDPQLVEHSAAGLQTPNRAHGMSPMRKIAERLPPPQLSRTVEMTFRPRRLRGDLPFGEIHEVLEPSHVDILRWHIEAITSGSEDDRADAQDPPKPRHRTLDHFAPRRRRMVPPQRVAQALGGHRVGSIQDERSQHDSIASGKVASALHDHRAQDSDAHTRVSHRRPNVALSSLAPVLGGRPRRHSATSAPERHS
jgi:hypothetical protein